MPETESEFIGNYTGNCVWAAVHMGAHRLAPVAWPVPSATILNRLTSEAIAADIGVGPRGEATPGQLKMMLSRWGMRYSIGYDYNGVPIAQAWLKHILDTALARGKPVLLGFTNGQALSGDERGLHGHEIVVLHPVTPAGYPCGDGDNPRCRQGELVYYPLAMLEAAQPDSAYILEEVPGMTVVWTKNADGTAIDSQGHHAGTGIADHIFADGKAGIVGLTSETYYAPNECFLMLADDTFYTWDPINGVHTDRAGIVATRIYAKLAAAEAAGVRTQTDVTNAAAMKLLATALQGVK